jgi:hypothetical protein
VVEVGVGVDHCFGNSGSSVSTFARPPTEPYAAVASAVSGWPSAERIFSVLAGRYGMLISAHAEHGSM